MISRTQFAAIIGGVCYLAGAVIMCLAGSYGTSEQIDWGLAVALFGVAMVAIVAAVEVWKELRGSHSRKTLAKRRGPRRSNET